jgi:hypothetical protein
VEPRGEAPKPLVSLAQRAWQALASEPMPQVLESLALVLPV